MVNRDEFFRILYSNCNGGTINLRFIHKDSKKVVNEFITLDLIETISKIVEKFKGGYDSYFGVATRKDKNGTKAGILQIPALWIDLDLKNLSREVKEDKRKKLKEFPLRPTLWVATGGGFHTYWLLKEPAGVEDIPVVENLLKRLSAYFGADLNATDSSRVLRIPGTRNFKYPFALVELKRMNPDNQYTLEDFDTLLPRLEEKQSPVVKPNEDWVSKAFEGVREGERNTTLTKLAGRYLGRGLTRDEILPILLEANSRFIPPLEKKEVEIILDSVGRTHARNHPENGLSESFENSNFKISLPTLADIYDMPITVEWVVEKLIPQGGITVLHGKGGIGKTWLMLQIGSCISEGKIFCGLNTKKTECYYIDFENPLSVLHDRALILGKSSLKIWHTSNPIEKGGPPPRLDLGEWERYKELSPGVLIIDSLRASQTLDENSSRDMSLIISRLKVLRDSGFTIILIHHTPKGDEKTYRGSTAIQDQADHLLSLERVRAVGDQTTVEDDDEDLPLRLGGRGKSRYETTNIYLRFDPQKGFELAPDPHDAILKKIYDLIVDFKNSRGTGPNQSQVLSLSKDHLGLNKNKTLRLLRKGEGRFWHTVPQPQSRAILYDPSPHFPIFTPYICLENGKMVEDENLRAVIPEITQVFENKPFTHFPEGIVENRENGSKPFSWGRGKKEGELENGMDQRNDPRFLIQEALKDNDLTLSELVEATKLPIMIVRKTLELMKAEGQVMEVNSGLSDPDEKFCYSLLFEMMEDGQVTY